MKFEIDTDAVVGKVAEVSTKVYDKAVEVTPDVKAKAKSFFDRIKEAAKEGKEAARK